MAQSSIEMQSIGYPTIAILSAALIVISIDPALRATRLSRFFQTRVMRILGKYSYALYVFHFPLAIVLQRMGLSILGFPRIAGSSVPGAIAFTAIAISISLVIALLSWHLYEKHFLRLKRFFPRREGDITNMPRASKLPDFSGQSTLSAPPREPEKVL
jgi:peptidoglycan/LPS O-acetylase OafA/YrhL